jgi:hypothetical protein
MVGIVFGFCLKISPQRGTEDAERDSEKVRSFQFPVNGKKRRTIELLRERVKQIKKRKDNAETPRCRDGAEGQRVQLAGGSQRSRCMGHDSSKLRANMLCPYWEMRKVSSWSTETMKRPWGGTVGPDLERSLRA